MKQFFFVALSFYLLTSANIQAQSLAINVTGAAAHSSAILDVSSTTKGLLIPRMNTTERNAISSPIAGLIIYNTTTSSMESYNGSTWVSVSTGFVPYSGATGAVNLGAYDLTLQGMRIGLGTGNLASNTVVGKDVLLANTTGYNNSGFGFNVLTNNTLGNNNTVAGYNALFSNLWGSENTALGSNTLFLNQNGSQNVAIGLDALYSNLNGIANIGIGTYALRNGQSGRDNIAMGFRALYTCEGNSNVGIGNFTLQNVQYGGDHNVAIGSNTLYFNTTGYWNTAIGNEALLNNTTGRSNTASGYRAMHQNTDGYWNTAFGRESLAANTTGITNTAIGMGAGSTITTGSNNTAVGSGAQVPNGTLSNQVRIGNGAITYAGVQVAWTITSDKQWKHDIQDSELGLEFLKTLRPVSYLRNNDDSKKKEYGFIAQEIESALNKAGAGNTGIISKDDKGMYGVRYNDLIAPMVKAIQELNEKNEQQAKQITELKLLVEKMKGK